MDRKTANREWRDVTRGAPEGVPTGRTVHDFAQRVEALAIAGCDKRHAAALKALAAVAALDMQGALCPASGHADALDEALRGVHEVLGAA